MARLLWLMNHCELDLVFEAVPGLFLLLKLSKLVVLAVVVGVILVFGGKRV